MIESSKTQSAPVSAPGADAQHSDNAAAANADVQAGEDIDLLQLRSVLNVSTEMPAGPLMALAAARIKRLVNRDKAPAADAVGLSPSERDQFDQMDPPDAPCHYDGAQASAWGSGWLAGYEAAILAARAAAVGAAALTDEQADALHEQVEDAVKAWVRSSDTTGGVKVERRVYIRKLLELARPTASSAGGLDEREAFEAWHRSKFATKHCTGQPTRDMHNGVYDEQYGPKHQQLMWEAWQAASANRAAAKGAAGQEVTK